MDTSPVDTHTADGDPPVGSAASVPTPTRLDRLGFPVGVRFWRESFLVVAVVAPLLTLVYRLWDASLRVPFTYFEDGLGTLAYTKSILENGWYFSNPRLGAPFIANWRDFPVGGENVHWFSMKVIGTITGDAASALNVYFLLSFFLIALAGYFVARYLRLGTAAALVVGVLYAFAPFHAFHLIHVARSVYYMVPFAMLVLLWTADYRREFLHTEDGATRWRRGRVGTAIAVVVILSSSDTQNAAYLITLLAVVAIIHSVRDRTWRPLAIVAVLGAITLGTLLVNNSPYLWSRHQRGPNPEVATRGLRDQDTFALRPATLLLPAPGHRIGAFADLTERATEGATTDGESRGTALGIIGSVGLLLSLGAVAAGALGTRPRDESGLLLTRLGLLNIVAIVIGTVGGLSYLFALAGFTQYRTWNRLSIFIAFASLLAVGLLLDRGFARIRTRVPGPRAAVIMVTVTGILVVGGAYDQTSPKFVPHYATLAAQYNGDATFYQTLERRLPRDAMVFQLPIAEFPEVGPIVNMADYAQFTAYLHSDALRWSYGGMKGRPDANWIRNVAPCDPPAFLTQLAVVGFDGVVLDTTGFVDGGEAFRTGAEPLVGSPRLRSPDGHLEYFDVTRLRSKVRAEVPAATRQEWINATLGRSVRWNRFSPIDTPCPIPLRWATERSTSVDITRGPGAASSAKLATDFDANPTATRITVRGPNFTEVIPLVEGRGRFERSVPLPSGRTTLRFTLIGPKVNAPGDQRTLWFGLRNANFDAVGVPTLTEWAHALAAASAP